MKSEPCVAGHVLDSSRSSAIASARRCGSGSFALDTPERVAEEIAKPGERDLALRLIGDRAQREETAFRSELEHIAAQRGLADPGLATDPQHIR